MANEGIEVEVYRYSDPYTRVDILNNRYDPQLMAELGDGGGSVKIPMDDLKINEDPTLLDYRNIIRFRVNGKIIGEFILKYRKNITIDEGEHAGEYYEISGPGPRGWFEDASVRPFYGLSSTSKDNRYFSFASEPGDWYVDEEWTASVGVNATAQAHWNGWNSGWPEVAKNVPWMWGQAYSGRNAPLGYNYFRKTFTTSDTANYNIYIAVDDSFDLYLDGEKLASSDKYATASGKATKVSVKSLPPGDHVIAIRAYNIGSSGLAGVRFGMTKEVGVNEVLVVSSAESWASQAYPEIAPGWSPGEIMITLLEEAGTRGVLFPGYLALDFNQETDSNGEPWGEPLDWVFKIGEDNLQTVVKKFEELVCSVWITFHEEEGYYLLHMAQTRGLDRSDYMLDPVDGTTVLEPIIFRLGLNVTKAESMGTANIKNSLAVKTDNGWLFEDVQDDDSITKYGVLEGSLNTGASEALSRLLAERVFLERAIAREGATYNVIALDEKPLEDYVVGDWCLAPNDLRELTKRRIMSISVHEDEAGNPRYVIEFDAIFKDTQSVIIDTLNKTGSGGVGSGYTNNEGGGTNPIGPIFIIPDEPPLRFPLPPENVNATQSGVWSANGMRALTEVTITWDAVTENTDGSDTLPEFYAVYVKIDGDDSSLREYARLNALTVTLTFEPDLDLDIYVQAININDQPSELSDPFSLTTEGPTAPLPQPDPPTLTVSKGLVTVHHTGLFDGGNPAPPQYRFTQVLLSDISGGPYPINGGTMIGAGQNPVNDLVIGETYYAVVLAFDGLGNVSPVSDEASILVTGIDLGDLAGDVEDAIEAAKEAGLEAKSSINLLSDSSFELNTQEFWDWNDTNVTNDDTLPRTGDRHLRVEAIGSDYEAVRYVRSLECDPGQSYLFQVFALAEDSTGTDSEEGGLELSILYGADDSTPNVEVIGSSQELLAGDYEAIRGTWLVPADTYRFRPRVMVRDTTSDNVYYLDDVRVFRMTGETLLVDGSVIADKLAAESVVASKIAAEAIAAEHIQAEAIIASHIGADVIQAFHIAAEQIEAVHIAAGAIKTNHISPEVGEQLNLEANGSIVLIAGQQEVIQSSIDDTQTQLEDLQRIYDFGPDGAIIKPGGSTSGHSLRLDFDIIEMLENNNVVSYWNSGQMHVNSLVATSLNLGKHQLEAYPNTGTPTGTVMKAL